MRSIEFRAWDGHKMIYNIIPWQWDYVLSRNWWVCLDNISDNESEFKLSGFKFKELMQFTGLTDKNGKKIWEGDIVAASHTPNQTVEYEHDRFILKPDNYDLWKVCEYWEVIGNEFENKELLNDSKHPKTD